MNIFLLNILIKIITINPPIRAVINCGVDIRKAILGGMETFSKIGIIILTERYKKKNFATAANIIDR